MIERNLNRLDYPISFHQIPPRSIKPLPNYFSKTNSLAPSVSEDPIVRGIVWTDETEQVGSQTLAMMANNSYNYISIRNGDWNKHNMTEVCKRIRRWPVDNGLFLCSNQHPQIYKDILNIWFPYLKKIDLGKNGIQSIEALGFLKTPSLTKINLSDNHLMSISPLRKAKYFGCLTSLDLWGNHLIAIDFLSQLQAPVLAEIRLDYYQDDFCPDFRKLGKFQCQRLSSIMILSENRIRMKKVEECLARRNRNQEEVDIGISIKDQK